MFKEVKGFKKEDLKFVAEEIGEDVPTNSKITDIKDIILESTAYEKDPEFVKVLLQEAISERKIREEKEDERIKEERLKEEQRLKYEQERIKEAQEQDRKYNFERAKLDHELELARIRAQVQNPIDSQPLTVESGNSRRKFTLPKLEFRQFGDDITEWLPFWSQFERIDQDEDIAPEDKFQYLVQATVSGSRAREVVESFPPTSANYEKAIESLKARFGREDLLVEVYVRQLLKLIISVQGKEKFSPTSLYDKLESYLRALETLGVTTDKCASILYPMVESCFPEEFLKAWNRSTTSSSRKEAKERLTDLMLFLKSEVEGEERISMAMAGFGLAKYEDTRNNKKKKYNQEFSRYKTSTAAGLLSTSSATEVKRCCVFCEGKHRSSDCFSAQKMSMEAKQKVLKEKRCCFACLVPGHAFRNCKAFLKCVVCGKKHFPLMCEKVESCNKLPPKEEVRVTENDVNLSNVNRNPKVFLQTLKAKLISEDKEKNVRLLLDSGSQKSYILKDIATEMNYPPLRQERITHLLFGGVSSKECKHDCYRIRLKNLNGQFKCNFEVLDQDVICENIVPVGKGSWLEELKMKNINLTDISDTCESIQILVGADIIGTLLTGRREVLSSGLVAIETYLGWTLMGKVPLSNVKNDSLAMTVTNLFVKEADISDLWKLDVIGIKDPIEKKSKLEQGFLTKKHFQETVDFNEEGRYEIHLPWSEDCSPLPDNFDLAKKRLEITTSKLVSNHLYDGYEKVFQEWQKEGIIEVVPDDEVKSYGHYLPHRPVIKESSTTPIRPVFDASARKQNSPSLNQCLECGPNLIELIPDILLRFRERKIGVTSDIRKAFLQISVCKEDRDFLRFLWWENQEVKKLKVFRHTRVVFGVKSSPFLLGAVIDHHVSKCEDLDSDFRDKLLKSFYVDNVVTSLDNREELKHFISKSTEVMDKGGFDLRGWENSEETSKVCENAETPILGLIWNREKDILRVNMKWLKEVNLERLTKRIILSVAHRVYDPIGYTSPVMLCPKILLQEAWKKGISWDEEITGDLRQQFVQWFDELKFLEDIHIPRWINVAFDNLKNCTIHCFCDASKEAFAAVVFLRIENENSTELSLLASKSRIAPLEGGTIPRLELLAVLVGARLTNSVIDALGWKDIRCYYWSDSTTVITWISREENWSVFVRNRVHEIRKLTSPSSWHHLPGEMNPSDLPSRGCLARKLLIDRWWEGPKWLAESEANWPSTEQILDEDCISQERRKGNADLTRSSVICFLNQANECELCDNSISRRRTNECRHLDPKWYYYYFSNYDKIVRMIAWVQRFVINCQQNSSSRRNGELSYPEIESAEKKIVKLIQDEYFVGENKKKLKNLSTYTDDDGIIRLNTKLTNRKDLLDFRSPMILPSDHDVIKRLIMTEHLKNSHAKSQMLTNILREHYWILNARKTVRSVVSKCVVCIRHAKQNLTAPTSSLPENRVKDTSIFEVIGFDMAGPLNLKGGNKAWICIYTCAVYRAVHFELVSSLSTEAFLQSLRRFIARRGRPAIVYCDNGRNFVGASNKLKNVDWNKIAQYSTTKKIQWFFNPPTAAWYGGFWERLIGVMKQILRRVLGNAFLSYEEMTTVLCDSEAVINSRPLTHVAESDSELIALSPNSFLQDFRQPGVPDLDQIDEKMLNNRLKYRQKLILDIRKRFRSEYLGLLIQKNDRKKHNREIHQGDIVLIGSDNTKCNNWPLGLVIELLPGKDKVTRVVRLKTVNGQLIRPIQRIYPLEVSSKYFDGITERDNTVD